MTDRTYGGKCPVHGRFGCTCGKPKAAPLHAITTVAERHERDGLSAATSTLRAWLNGDDVAGPALVAELRYWLDYWGGAGTDSARSTDG